MEKAKPACVSASVTRCGARIGLQQRLHTQFHLLYEGGLRGPLQPRSLVTVLKDINPNLGDLYMVAPAPIRHHRHAQEVPHLRTASMSTGDFPGIGSV